MNILQTVRVLIVNESADAAEHILNTLRAGEITVRPKLVGNNHELAAIIDSHWDLCLVPEHCAKLPAENLLQEVRSHEKDFPILVLSQDHCAKNRTKFIELGAYDAIPEDDLKLLQVLALKALQELTLRRQLKLLERELHDSETLGQHLLANSREAITFIHDGLFMTANSAFLHLFGYSDFDEIISLAFLDLAHHKNRNELKSYLNQFQQDQERVGHFSCEMRRADGTHFQTELSLTKALYKGESCLQLVARLPEEKQKSDTSYDQDLVTGLHNRPHLLEELDYVLAIVAQDAPPAALLYLEINGFNLLKREYGLSSSDLILSDVSACLQKVVHKDNHLAARFDDDVFVILMRSATIPEAESLAQQIQDELHHATFSVNEGDIDISLLIGITCITETSPNSQEVLARAHTASSQAQKTDSHIATYANHESVHDEMINKIISANIQQALAEGNFELKYQPIVSLHGETDEIYEVLVRMLDENGAYISTETLLQAAHHTDLLTKIDRWVLLHATKVLAERRLNGHNSFLFVMLSISSLQDKSLLPWISAALKSSRLPSDAIIFELRETDAATHLAEAKYFTQGLKELHCKTCISHFGSGLNSFHTLQHLAVDYVKLDGIYTRDIYNNEKDAKSNLTNMITAVHAQGKLVVVPMVEDARIMPILWQTGTNYLQGYFLSPPCSTMDYDFEGNMAEL